jgi:coenzyme PQQ synthesis protein D (PqqD)
MMRLRENDLTWHVAGDDVVVLDLEGSVYLKVNGSGRVLWELLSEPRTEAELQSALVEQYGIDAQRAGDDVVTFLAELRRRGVLED